MKITFPHMGNTYIVAKSLLDDLGIDYVIPSFNNKKALETGTKYAPDPAIRRLRSKMGMVFQSFNLFYCRNCICIWSFIVNDIEHITDKVALYIFTTFYNNTFISVVNITVNGK